jgi:prevent-host-death family protein
MKTVSFTQFRSHASGLLSAVEKGEVVIVLRHGRPIAEVTPVTGPPEERVLSWKQPGLRLQRKGAVVSRAILEERRT